MARSGGRAATFTCVNGTVSCFCNKRLQNDLPFTRTLACDKRHGLLIALPINEKIFCLTVIRHISIWIIKSDCFFSQIPLYLIKCLPQLEIMADMLNRPYK